MPINDFSKFEPRFQLKIHQSVTVPNRSQFISHIVHSHYLCTIFETYRNIKRRKNRTLMTLKTDKCTSTRNHNVRHYCVRKHRVGSLSWVIYFLFSRFTTHTVFFRSHTQRHRPLAVSDTCTNVHVHVFSSW